MKKTFGFIGGGNMARALIGGLVARSVTPAQIIVADPLTETLARLHRDYGVRTATDNLAVAREAAVVVLAVKPQELRAVALALRAAFDAHKPLVISVAAGIRAGDIHRWTGAAVIRCMPNRPALQGNGVTALFAADASPADRALAEEVLSCVGKTLWVEREADMDTVTAISGSGPAYFFLLIEALEEAGVELGLRRAVSRTLAIETAYGAGAMARGTRESPATLRDQVTSKGGTTEAALTQLEAAGVRAIFTRAVVAAARRSAELAEEFGK